MLPLSKRPPVTDQGPVKRFNDCVAGFRHRGSVYSDAARRRHCSRFKSDDWTVSASSHVSCISLMHTHSKLSCKAQVYKVEELQSGCRENHKPQGRKWCSLELDPCCWLKVMIFDLTYFIGAPLEAHGCASSLHGVWDIYHIKDRLQIKNIQLLLLLGSSFCFHSLASPDPFDPFHLKMFFKNSQLIFHV